MIEYPDYRFSNMEKKPGFVFFLFGFIIIHIILQGNIAASESYDVKGIIGAILDGNSRIGREQEVAMNMALEVFNHYRNQSFFLYIRISQGDPLQAAIAARDLIDNQKVQSIIGPQTWEETSLMAEICRQKSIPLLSLADTTPEWAMKKWHFLLQSSHSQIIQMKAIAEMIKSWEPYKVTMIYEDGDSSSTKVSSQLSTALRQVGKELSNVVGIPPLVSNSLSQELEKLRERQYGVFIVRLSFPLALHLFETAKKMKLIEEGDKLHSNLSRVAIVVWLFVALIITQTYTASLTSIQQLRNSNAMVGYDRGSYLKRYLQDALNINAQNIKQFDSPENYADSLRNKEIEAAFLDIPEAKLFLAKHCKGFAQAGPTYKIGGYGFVLLQQSLSLRLC